MLALSMLALAALLGVISIAFGNGGDELGFSSGPDSPHLLGILLLALGFFALGIVDDISDGSAAKGIRGHLAALRKGTVTGGLIKAVGGLTLAFIVSMAWEGQLLPAGIDALIIALSANFFNLLDLRPGRACKIFFLAWIPLAFLSSDRAPVYLPLSAGFAGAVSGWLPSDLGEEAILGDSGSNMLGAIVGAGLVLVAGFRVQLYLLALLLALTIASEKVSFTRLIASFPPLNWLDRVGRAPE